MFCIISVGHLIISNKSHGKNITTCISYSLEIEYYFQKICELETHLDTVHHSVFGLEKRNCTFRNGRTKALKWRTSRMHRIRIMDFTDKNIWVIDIWMMNSIKMHLQFTNFLKIILYIQAVWNICCNIFSTTFIADYQMSHTNDVKCIFVFRILWIFSFLIMILKISFH